LPAATPASEGLFLRLADLPHEYVLCDRAAHVDALLEALAAADAWTFDTETTGLEPWRDRLVGLSFCVREGKAWYVPVPAEPAAAQALLTLFRPAFLRAGTLKIGHNLKFDLAVMRHAGVEVAGPLSDTMLAHYVVDPTDRHGMDHLARALLRYDPIPITALIGAKGPAQTTMDQVPLAQIAEYAAEDADVTMRLHTRLRGMVADAQAGEALDRCENALLPVLLDMESEGVRIDAEVLRMYSAELAVEIDDLETQIRAAAGMDFNIASPKQLGVVLFEHLKLPPAGRTPTGQYETSEEVLSSLVGQHPIISLILEHRACTKLKSTYVDKLPACIRADTGRIHTSFNQALAETGRLSSDNPNLQNIPIRTERGKRIREAFVPRDRHHMLMSADYSQVELRVMAALSGDEGMIAAFRNNADIHLETAARVHGIETEFVTPEMRSQAKMVNFGIIYGISAFGLAQRLGIPRKQAAELIDAYFKMYPSVRHYMDRTVTEAREKGYVTTLLGRRRPLRDIASRNGTLRAAAERTAINTPVQGTAADLIKLAMVAVHTDLRDRGLKSKLVLQVHDELVLDVLRDEVEEVREIVIRRMSGAMQLAVPLRVDVGVGSNWLEAH
jgi:DNA polymerase-1